MEKGGRWALWRWSQEVKQGFREEGGGGDSSLMSEGTGTQELGMPMASAWPQDFQVGCFGYLRLWKSKVGERLERKREKERERERERERD